MTRSRVAPLVGVMLGAALLLTGCPRPNGYQAVQVFPQLHYGYMVGLLPVPGGGNTALLVTQDGLIRRTDLSRSGDPPTVFLDVRDRVIPLAKAGGEEGLLGLAFAPDYETSGKFYIYYTVENPRHNRISRFVAHGDRADPASEHVIVDLPDKTYSNHNGGDIIFGPDGYLYVGVGDGGGAGDPDNNGQNTDSLFGKILRIDVSGDAYAIPPDNPFVSGGGRPEIYAYGLRNPWRLNFDPATGELWAADVGQNSWEEVDRIVKGGNYGWSVAEGNHCFKPATGCDTTGMIPPRTEYGHDLGCAITGGFVYRGNAMPEMQGWYVYGDFCSGRVWAVDAASDSGAAIPLADTGAQITSFAQDGDGELYLVTYNNAVYKLVRKPS